MILCAVDRMTSSWRVPSGDVPTKRRKRRLVPVLLVAVVGLGAGIYVAARHAPQILGETGCTAGAGRKAVALDPEQAQLAATIAGVAHQRGLPSRAVTVAYAAAMQETHLHNLDYGDRDSVGVFQQRPSEGWGPASKLINPVYASTKFFQALTRVRDYQHLPVYKAAQAVQHSADGYAYAQYQHMAARLTVAFTGASPRAVWCWPPADGDGGGTAQFLAARRALVETFGSLPAHSSASAGDAPSLLVRASQADTGWAVAAWLVTHAGQYALRDVSYAGFQWRASSGGGWRKDKMAPATAVLAT
jgi:hypothetical protein